MPCMLTPDGEKIKAIRNDREAGYKQWEVAEKARLSVRTLRRIENENHSVKEANLRRLAGALGVPLDIIALSTGTPRLVNQAAGSESPDAAADKGRTTIPRFDTTYLHPLEGGAQELVRLAEAAQEIVPHFMVDADSERFALIEELLLMLKANSTRKWSGAGPLVPDSYDEMPFPEAGRFKRLAELLVLLKGNDILVCADTHSRYVPEGEAPRVADVPWYFQLLVAFIPPDEHGDHVAEVPIDHGRDIRLQREPILPSDC